MMNTENDDVRAKKLATAMQYTAISFLAAVIANLLFIALSVGEPLVYGLIPFNLAYIFCVAWLAKVTYGWLMAVISVVLVLLPVGVLVIMLFAYTRARTLLQRLGYKVTCLGKVQTV